MLPGGSRVIESRRDYIVVRLPLGEGYQQLTAIWDKGRDEQLLDVITAIYYRDRQLCSRIVGLAMERGVLTVWYASTAHLEQDRNAIQIACDAALNAPAKRWVVAALQAVPMDTQR